MKKKLFEVQKVKGSDYDPVEAAEGFKDDTADRIIDIKVSKASAGGYDVTCTVYYSDNTNVVAASGVKIGKEIGMETYEAYKQHFEKLPDIYLMYNVGVYNDRYTQDYITYDISGVDNTDNVNVFVVETASDYSTDVKTANGENNWLKGGTDGLYRKANGEVRDSAKIGMAQLSAATGGTLYVYHNLYQSPSDTDWDNHKKNILSEDDYGTTVATEIRNIFNDASKVYETLSNVINLNEAQDGNRGLYKIKVWMQEGDSASTSKNPIVQGTRGGGESD